MFVNLLAFIAAGVWVFGFMALGRVLLDVLQGKRVSSDQEGVWLLIGICFGVGVGMLVILGMLGFFAETVMTTTSSTATVRHL